MFKKHVCTLSKLDYKSDSMDKLSLDEKALLDSFVKENRGLLKTLAEM